MTNPDNYKGPTVAKPTELPPVPPAAFRSDEERREFDVLLAESRRRNSGEGPAVARVEPVSDESDLGIKPCPFCGSRPDVWYEGDGEAAGRPYSVHVFCEDCGAKGPPVVISLCLLASCLHAVENWNASHGRFAPDPAE